MPGPALSILAGVTQTPNAPINLLYPAHLDTTNGLAVVTEGFRPSYSGIALAYAPYAAAQDIFALFGSASRTGRALEIGIMGRSTAANQIDVQVLKRVSANTGGSSTPITQIPSDPNDQAATMTMVTYGAAPTAGTSLGAVRVGQLNMSTAGSGGFTGLLVWRFGDINDKAEVLRGTGSGLCINLNGQTIPAGTTLDIWVRTIEDLS